MDILKVFVLGFVVALATNVDKVVVFSMFHSSVPRGLDGRYRRRIINLGCFIGSCFGLLIYASVILGIIQLPIQEYLFWLGLIPISMGAYFLIRPGDNEIQTAGSTIGKTSSSLTPLIQYIVIALVLSIDDLGVYIPLVAEMGASEILIIMFVAIVNIILVIYVSQRISNISVIKRYLDKVGRWLIPFIFILIGSFILISGYMGL